MDFENDELITLISENGEEIDFYPIAKILLRGKTFMILQPVELLDGMGEDEALVFEYSTIDDQDHFEIVLDDGLIDEVFEEYNRLYEEENGK